jgi:hypothetical protein
MNNFEESDLVNRRSEPAEVEEHKLTPEFSKWNKDRKKIQEMGITLRGELLTTTRKAQLAEQTFMDFTRLWEFHKKVEPQEQTYDIPGM